jgi:hypothetical protein
LTYLPGKHLAAIVKMNEEKWPRGEINKFLQDNMPDAEEDLAGALANSVIFMWVLVATCGVSNGYQ